MTRKVTAVRFRKRLLLRPYTCKLFSSHPRTHPHIIRRDVSLVYNNKTRYIFPTIVVLMSLYQILVTLIALHNRIACCSRKRRAKLLAGLRGILNTCSTLTWVVGNDVSLSVLFIFGSQPGHKLCVLLHTTV
jgi:hypothetical protein